MQLPALRQPRLLQTLRWVTHPCELLDDGHRRFGDFFELDVMGLGRLAVVADPEAVATVFRGDPALLRTGESNALVVPLLGESSLLAMDEPEHLPARRDTEQHFTRSVVDGHRLDIRKASEELTAKLPRGHPFALHPWLRRFTLRVILTILFGRCEPEKLERYMRAFAPVTGELVAVIAYVTALQRDLGPLSIGGWFQRKIGELDALIAFEVEERRAGRHHGPGGVLSAMLESEPPPGVRRDAQAIRDRMMTLLAAGHETIASALAWAIQWIVVTPGVLERVRAEIDAAPEDARALPYLEACCDESFRISPVVEAVSRVAREPMELAGYEIAAGTLVTPAIHLVHHRPDLYPEPHRFRPERFLERRYRGHEFLPFGGGQRLCIGRTLALEEMKLVLRSLLSSLDFRLVDERPPRAVRRNVTIAPAGGLRVVCDPRC